MFVTTVAGAIKALMFPLPKDVPLICQGTDHYYHTQSITQICTTFNERFLFTADAEGCVWIFRLQDKAGRLAKIEKDNIYSDEVFLIDDRFSLPNLI